MYMIDNQLVSRRAYFFIFMAARFFKKYMTKKAVPITVNKTTNAIRICSSGKTWPTGYPLCV